MARDLDFDEKLTKLQAPFGVHQIKWRVGATNKEKNRGLALAYLDARDVMDRLDQVIGPGNWSDTVTFHDDGRATCTISIWDGEKWIWKSDGAGASDIEGPKGASSDAFKRAGVKLGIGRPLYRMESPWVEIQQKGRTSVITARGLQELENYLQTGTKPKGEGAPRAEPSASAPAASSDAGIRITPDDRKKLYGMNFEALKKLGHTKEEIDEMESNRKFAPINFATAAIGCSKVEHVKREQLQEFIRYFDVWVEEQEGIKRDEQREREPGDARHDDYPNPSDEIPF